MRSEGRNNRIQLGQSLLMATPVTDVTAAMAANFIPLQEHQIEGLYPGAPSEEQLGEGTLAVEAALTLIGRAPLALDLDISTSFLNIGLELWNKC